jgi:hypothetical protein
MSAPDFWKTLNGLLARLADIAHHFTWSSLNTTVKETVAVIEPEERARLRLILKWETMGDERVCDYCEEQEGEYEFDDPFLPMIPAHVMCRCWWTIEEE